MRMVKRVDPLHRLAKNYGFGLSPVPSGSGMVRETLFANGRGVADRWP